MTIIDCHPATGIYGQRAANIIIQKATHLYCFGARLDEQTVAYRYDNFAPNAIKYVYDIDKAEIDKLPSNWISRNEIGNIVPGTLEWLAWCKGLYIRFRPELEGVNNQDSVDPFRFVSLLSDYAQPDDIIVAGAGKAGETLMQAFKVKAGQRVLTLSTNGAMGYDIPLSIGAAISSGRPRRPTGILRIVSARSSGPAEPRNISVSTLLGAGGRGRAASLLRAIGHQNCRSGDSEPIVHPLRRDGRTRRQISGRPTSWAYRPCGR